MQIINSPQNPYIKHLLKLIDDSDYRTQEKKIVLEGKTLIKEIAPLVSDCTLLMTEDCGIACRKKIQISPSVANKLTQTENSEAIFAEVPLPRSPSLEGVTRLLVLDGVSDPGNLGTLLRTALGLGWGGVFFLQGCCDPFNAKVLRASKGALFQLPYLKGTWEELKILMQKENWTPFAADMKGNLPKIPAPSKLMLVLGNEGVGLSEKTRDYCSLVSIPLSPQMESLNVAIAGAILMYILRLNG